jgi:hypothetical protein
MSDNLHRAARVREAMLDGVLREAMDEVEAGYAAALLNCHESPEARERLWLAVQVAKKLRQQLASWEAGGAHAERRQAEITRLARVR